MSRDKGSDRFWTLYLLAMTCNLSQLPKVVYSQEVDDDSVGE